MIKNPLSKGLSVAVAAILASTGEPANAAFQQTVNCSVSYVQYSNELLGVSCGGTEYRATGPGWTACPYRQSMDSLKMWTALAQSARLAGRTLTINWDNGAVPQCGFAITLIRMN